MVMRMESDFRSGFVREENVRQFLTNPMNWLFACIENGRIIGFAYGYELNRMDDIGNMLYIHEVNVLPEYHRQGIARTMLESIKSACKLLGMCRFFLITRKSNVPACKLYESVGGVSAHDDNDVYYFQCK